MGAGAGNLIGGLATLFSDDPGKKYLEQYLRLLQQIQDPNFDWSQITPAQLQFIAEVDPAFYEANVPTEVKQIGASTYEAPQARSLRGLEKIGAEGMPLVDRISAEITKEGMAGEMAANRDAILRELASRGRLGAGSRIQAQAASDQAISNMLGQAGRGIASDAATRRMGALESSGALATAGRTQDIERQRRNAEMVNNMNRYISALKTDEQRYAADTLNRQREVEAAGRQRVSDVNRLNIQATAESNQARQNELQQLLFSDRLARAGMQGGAFEGLAESDRARRAALERNLQTMGSGGGQAAGGLYDRYTAAGGSEKPADWIKKKYKID
ncbi:MAG: hypothetical protein ACYTAN_17660 [Planctomycetota bacterium]|jgi:hypothetical protein